MGLSAKAWIGSAGLAGAVVLVSLLSLVADATRPRHKPSDLAVAPPPQTSMPAPTGTYPAYSPSPVSPPSVYASAPPVEPPTEVIGFYPDGNGYLVRPEKTGLGKLTISNGAESNAIIKLINVATDRKALSLYVAAGTDYTTTNIADGTYELIFCFGSDAITNGDRFMKPKGSAKFDRYVPFTTTATTASGFKLTLHKVASGDARTSDIPIEQFDSY